MEAIYLVCGARRPPLKRNPLGRTLWKMLTPAQYWIAMTVTAVLCGTIAQRVAVGGSARAWLLGWLGPAIPLAVLGYLDWSAETVKETPLETYVLAATLTPLAALGTVILLRTRAPRAAQWTAAVFASFGTQVGVLVISLFF